MIDFSNCLKISGVNLFSNSVYAFSIWASRYDFISLGCFEINKDLSSNLINELNIKFNSFIKSFGSQFGEWFSGINSDINSSIFSNII